jgi:hypothetical protein
MPSYTSTRSGSSRIQGERLSLVLLETGDFDFFFRDVYKLSMYNNFNASGESSISRSRDSTSRRRRVADEAEVLESASEALESRA